MPARASSPRAGVVGSLLLVAAAAVAGAEAPATPSWATELERRPDPAVVPNADTRRAIEATGLPWRVTHAASGVEMLLVPPGTYLRGAAADDPFDRANERPQHPVTISRPFYLGRYEVTNAQMRRYRPAFSSGTFYRDEDLSLDGDDQPAVDVSWMEAMAFAVHFGFRLPTEAEWEHAARAGVRTRYPWGDEVAAGEGWGNVFGSDTQARIVAMDWSVFPFADGFHATAPIGSFRPNAWGFYDLLGNAWEHVLDGFDDDAYQAWADGATDPVLIGGDRRTLRGGGWGNAPRGSGIPYRFGMDADDRHDGNGFRVLMSVPEEAGGTPRAFERTADPAWQAPGVDGPPTWSADGEEVLFQRTGRTGRARIWAIRYDGSGLRPITDGSFAAGHPDVCAIDGRIALVSDREGVREVYVMASAGGPLRRLTHAGPDKAWPVFSPDCRRIVYVAMSDRPAGRYDLMTVDIASGSADTVLEAVRYLGWPTWTADGAWIVFHREIAGYPNHLWRVRPDGSGAEALIAGDHGDYWSGDMSRDGNRFSFAFSGRAQLEWGANADLWLVDGKDGTCRRVRGAAWHEHGKRLSPDGRRLVFWDTRHGDLEVTVMDLASGATLALTAQPAGELTTIARERGAAAAIAHAALQTPGVALYSEAAMTRLLATRAGEVRPAAVALAERFLADHPRSRRALAALARERFRAGWLASARTAYLDGLAEEPASPEILARLGALAWLEHATGRPLDAPEAAPPDAPTINSLGYALMRGGHLDAAIDVLAWNVDANPDAANAYDSLGEALYWRGAHATARIAYQAALARGDSNENARRFLRRIEAAEHGGASIPCPRWPQADPVTAPAAP